MEEKRQITPVVYSNTIMSMKILVEQASLLGEEVCTAWITTECNGDDQIAVRGVRFTCKLVRIGVFPSIILFSLHSGLLRVPPAGGF